MDSQGRPIDIPFDEDVTYMPVGTLGGYFKRDVGLYMWRNIPFDVEGWKNVDKDDQNALMEHMRVRDL